MSFELNKLNIGAISGVNRASEIKKFEEEKEEALSAAKGNSNLTAKINSVQPGKAGLVELEALLAQALQEKSFQASQISGSAGNNTLGIA